MQIDIFHSPDADDRFMFWPIASGALTHPRFQFRFFEAPTSDLNRIALEKKAHVCAISAIHYLRVANYYQPMRMGASVGSGYGPVVVQKTSSNHLGESLAHILKKTPLLTPGHTTTAHFILEFCTGVDLSSAEEVSIFPMERVFDRLGQMDSGCALLIHEGRLRFREFGTHCLADLGKLWAEKTGGLNLPLGINVISRELPEDVQQEISLFLRESFYWAQNHREDFVIQNSGANLSMQQMREYLDLYANDTTADLHQHDRNAFEILLHHGAQKIQVALPKFAWI